MSGRRQERAASRVWNYLDEAAGVGWSGLEPRAVLAGGGRPDPCRVTFTARKAPGGAVVRAKITNTGRKPVGLRAIRWSSCLDALWPPPAMLFPKSLEPFYFATENFRGDYFGTATTRGEHYFKPLPNETVTLGFSQDLVFPGVFIGSRKRPVGLLCAAASRRIFEPVFRLHGGDGEKRWNFEIEERPQGLGALRIGPGESVEGEDLWFSIATTNDPQQATDGYYAELRRGGVFARVRHNPLPKQRIWGSWNFGYYDKVNEEEILKQLPILRERFPSVRFVQIDHGYERIYPCGHRAQIDFLYNTDTPYNPETFPHGPEYIVRKIKEAGLRPATWLGLWASGESDMIRENPDWVLLDDSGRRMAFLSRFSAVRGGPFELCVLDPSVPGVRRYIERVSRTVLGEWGFEGLKLDFYSFAFQIRRARFRRGNETAAQHLQWLADTFRRRLPRDGFLGWCSVAGTGTPLMGVGADYFRTGEDISEGEWALAKRIASWFANTKMLLQQHPILPDIDSIGWGPRFDPVEWETFLNFCAVSGGALEIAGDLTKLDAARCERLRRTLELSDPARRVRFADVPWGKVELPPAIWVSEGKGRGDLMVGVFNWADKARTIDMSPLGRSGSGWPKAFKPVFAAKGLRVGREGVSLPAHGSALFVRGAVR